MDVLREIEETKSYLSLGVSSLFSYCTRILKLSESETGRFIHVTRKASVVPEFKEALDHGLLTVSQASRIASVVETSPREWIEKTLTLSQKEIEREVSRIHPRALPQETLRPLTPSRTELRLSVSVDMEKKLRRAQEVLRTKNLEDTLEAALDFILKSKDPVAKAQRVEKKVPQHPLRNVPPSPKRPYLLSSLKHKVALRDQGQCTFPGCGEKRYVEIHHVIPLSQGGKNELSNLTTLCSAHHKFTHGTHLGHKLQGQVTSAWPATPTQPNLLARVRDHHTLSGQSQ